jgi:hypothetical protein
MEIGIKIEFVSQRVMEGNPVKGKLTAENNEWITVELDHDIRGIQTTWFEGEEKQFKKELIEGEIKIIS